MISKIFSSPAFALFKCNSFTVSSGFNFCTTPYVRHESHPLRNKIMDLSSFDQFHNFYRQKKEEFDGSCYSAASRALAKILIETKIYMNFNNRQLIKNYISSFQKLDLSTLNLQQFSHLLYLLRVIKLDPNNNNSFVNTYIKSLLDRSESKLRQLEADSSLSRLSYFYQEYCGLNSKYTSQVAKKINQVLKDNNSEVQSHMLSVSQINLILRGMKYKNTISTQQTALLKTIIRTVTTKYLDTLSFLELAQISVGLNEVLSNNVLDPHVIGYAEQVHKKVLANVDQLDEKSIMFILNAKKTTNKTFNQIYKVIFDKILDEIQPNGQSSFNQLFTLRLFNGMSGKVRLGLTSTQNQQKFFAFLKHTLTKTPRFIHSFIETYVERGFFNHKQLTKLVQILESIPDFNFRLSLIYQISQRNVDVEKLFQFDILKESELKDGYLIMMMSILNSLVQKKGSNTQKFEQGLSNFKQRFFSLYKPEDGSWSKLIFYIDAKVIVTLYDLLRKDIGTTFPNPFETQQPQKYRSAWLKFLIFGASAQNFTMKEINLIKKHLVKGDFEYVFRMASYEKADHGDWLANILTLCTRSMDYIVKDTHAQINLARIIGNNMLQIFDKNQNQTSQIRFWHALNDLLEKTEPSKYFSSYSTVISSMFRSDLYVFKYSQQYQTFLQRILKKINHVTSKYLLSEFIKESLRLNLIKRQDVATLPENIRDLMGDNQKLMLKMIESNAFVLQGVELSRSNLYLYLYNLSPETSLFIQQNTQKMLALVEQMRPKQLWKCISSYRLGSRKRESIVFDALFKSLNKYNFAYEEFSPIYIGEILRRNHFQKNQSNIENVKIYMRKSMEYFTQRNKLTSISLEDHINLLKTANDIKIKNDDYMHAILDKFRNDNTIFYREAYLTCGQIGLTLNAKQLTNLIDYKHLFTRFSSSFSKSFNIFLLFEDQLPNAELVLKEIIQKYNEFKENQKISIYSIYFEYIKKKYPEATKTFQPNHIEKADFCKSVEFYNLKNVHLLKNLIEQCTQTKWTQNILFSNYYYTFRNVAIVFPSQVKYQNQNVVLKRLLKQLTGIDKLIVLNKGNMHIRTTLKYLTINYSDLMTEAEILKINAKLEEINKKRNQARDQAQRQVLEQAEAEQAVNSQIQPTQEKPTTTQ